MNINFDHSAKELGLQVTILTLLIISTSFVYHNVSTYEFINYDDPLYITGNNFTKEGLTFQNIVWAFTNVHAFNWHPITWLSHMLDIELFGLNAGGHHLMNVFIHICNTLLLYLLFRKSTGDIYKSAVLAAFFALHPLHVESVAWIAERKDVLCAFFWLLAMLAYYRYTQRPSPARYILAFICFIFGSLSKSMMVTFPFALLLFDYWPLNRYVCADVISDVHFPKNLASNHSWAWLVIEKIPMIAVSIIISLVAVLTQTEAMADIQDLPIFMRLANALMVYIIYIKKMIWPGNLCVMYPLEMPPLWLPGAGLVFIAGALALAFALRRRHGYLLFGLLWYFGTLVPVIGIIQVGAQAMADRYTYIPSIGAFTALIWGVSTTFSRLPTDRIFKNTVLALLLTATALSLMMLLTSQQVRYWKNSITLMGNAVQVTQNNYIAHQNLGLALADQGLHDEALYHFKQVIVIKPNYAEAYMNIGSYYLMCKEYEQAINFYQKTISLKPSLIKAYALMGKALTASGKPEKAAWYFDKIHQLSPGKFSLRELTEIEHANGN